MYTSTAHSTKRFPTPCRFFSQGNCRAGQDCLFAHILPIKGEPSNARHTVLVGDLEDDTNSMQKAIQDVELDQLEKKYKLYFQRTSLSETHRIIELLLPMANPLLRPLQLRLLIPYDYPETPCSIQIQNHDIPLDAKRHIQDAFAVHEWSQTLHTTLVQQLDWLSIHTPTLLGQTR